MSGLAIELAVGIVVVSAVGAGVALLLRYWMRDMRPDPGTYDGEDRR